MADGLPFLHAIACEKIAKKSLAWQWREIQRAQMTEISWIPFLAKMRPFRSAASTEPPRQTGRSISAPQALTRASWQEKSAPGFTLIEALMAAAILAIGLMGVASVIARASLQDVRAGHVSRGSFLVEEFLENASRAQYSAQAFRSLADTATSRVIDGVRFSMNCTLADNTPLERCKEITCTLSWDNNGASARYVYVLSPKF